MNERIRELSKQANAWYPEGYPSAEGSNAEWENLVIFDKEDLEKFAELIVRECAWICEREGYRLSMDDTTENHRDLAKQCHKIGIILTEQFGVKE
jgi:hypothetical protein